MKLIPQSVQLLPQEYTLVGAMKAAEYAGRICYNSVDKITEKSYKGFIKGLIANKHFSPLAHGIIYLQIPAIMQDIINTFYKSHFSTVTYYEGEYYISTNLRVLYEDFNDIIRGNLYSYIVEPTKFHIPYYSFEVITSIGVSRELNRHSTSLAICEQSTRFCNFSKDKFNKEIQFIRPEWYYNVPDCVQKEFVSTLDLLETNYMNWLNMKLKPEQARAILPLETATKVIYTGNINNWNHVLSLRSSDRGAKNVHPECSEIANKINKYVGEGIIQQA